MMFRQGRVGRSDLWRVRKKSEFFVLFLLHSLVTSLNAQPAPYPAHPDVQTVVEQINADSILSYVTRLQNFHTRHTYSDTTSQTVGIGAALRWVESRVEAYDSVGLIEVEWFPWTGNQTRHNLIARKLGESAQPGRYIIGGHIDSRNANGNDNTGFAPGANDNASSCAGFLEMVRLLSTVEFDHDCEIIWFTGEEQGLLGSSAYANFLDNQNARVDGMIAMDINGRVRAPGGAIDSMSLRLYAEGTFQQGSSGSPSRRLQRYLKWVGEAYIPDFQMVIHPASDRPGRGSDHLSFSGEGYPAVRFIERNEDVAFQHNTTDVVGELVPTYTRRNAMCAMAGMLTMLRAPLAPAAPFVLNTDSSYALILIPDSIELPAGGHFFIAKRNLSDDYWDDVVDIGESREYLYGPMASGETIWISLARSNADGYPSPFSMEVQELITSDTRDLTTIPSQFDLSVFPNPFNSGVSIRYTLSSFEHVTISAYDLLGRNVARIFEGGQNAGEHEIVWQPDELAGGSYFCTLSTAHGSLTHKVLYLK